MSASERPAPATGTGPSESAPAKKRTQAEDSASAPLFPVALPWARALIDRASGLLPSYGSPEWDALPDGPEKVAATVVAAEAWRTYWDPAECALRLRIELAAAHAYEEQARWTPEVVERVRRTANQPSFMELCERRGEPEAKARAVAHRRRLGLPVADRDDVDAPTHHVDGRSGAIPRPPAGGG